MKNSIIDNLDIIDFAKKSEDFDIDIFDISKHGIINVYGNDEQPSLFLKEVEVFDLETLKQISEIHHLCWNFQKVLFLYVYSKTEIRIYNCSEKPFAVNENINFKNELEKLELFSCKETDKSKLVILNNIFSRLAIDTGFIWSSEEARQIKEKIWHSGYGGFARCHLCDRRGFPQNRNLEAKKLGIPLIGVVDSNHSPIGIDYVIPGNDDSSKAVALYARGIADAIIEGRASAGNEVVKMVQPESTDEFVEVQGAAA